MVHFIHLMPLCILDNMAREPMSISDEDYRKVNEAIEGVKEDGKSIRSIFESYYEEDVDIDWEVDCLLYTSPSPRDATLSRMPSSA